VSGIPLEMRKIFGPGLSLILASSERQSKLDIEKVLEYLNQDPEIYINNQGADHVVLGDSSKMTALPATEKTVRGHSSPIVIILDEAARIPDELYYGGVRPMLTENPLCVLVMLSTGWGKRGAFYETWNDPVEEEDWLRVEVRAPWDIARGELVPAMPEAEYRALRAREGIHAFYSPRHRNKKLLTAELKTVGERWFRQEYLCEFVDTLGGFFDMEAVRASFDPTVTPLFTGRSDGRADYYDETAMPLFPQGVSA
jgi:hypothetical protein